MRDACGARKRGQPRIGPDPTLPRAPPPRTTHSMRPSAVSVATLVAPLYSTLSTFAPGSTIRSSISSFSVMPPPARDLPATARGCEK